MPFEPLPASVLFSDDLPMTANIQTAIDNLVDALRKESPERMIAFRLFVNCEERVIETTERTPAELKSAGISMRNLRGDFISENATDETRER